MYDYIATRIEFKPCNETITDLMAAFLADIGFESFIPDEKGLTSYIRKDKYSVKKVEEIVESFPIDCEISLSSETIEGQDWNKEWEQNYFQPILINDQLLIRSSFHPANPQAEMEIIIDPKMAFGTGHHATTAGMSKMLLKRNLKGKVVIDMGTGTGILSILAKKLGAEKVIGIDIDRFAIENAVENGRLNNMEGDWIVGDEKVLNPLSEADIFLANINLNVITENLSRYVAKLKKGGEILLSGFLTTDREAIIKSAEKEGLRLIDETAENNWQTMAFQKV
ncbi:MAG: 50S ribosomal protein L11 methyltransferase [Muribaculaceae bacterium]|nr:50S ribosomal protein L11 methyltransferase [Muribaculaceae bacterium]